MEDESDPLYESLEEIHVLVLAHVLRCDDIILTIPISQLLTQAADHCDC